MTPVRVAAICLLATPLVVVASAALTSLIYERVWLPRIAGAA